MLVSAHHERSEFKHTNMIRVPELSFGSFVDMNTMVLMSSWTSTISPLAGDMGISHKLAAFANEVD
jgi:hypothetical protein